MSLGYFNSAASLPPAGLLVRHPPDISLRQFSAVERRSDFNLIRSVNHTDGILLNSSGFGWSLRWLKQFKLPTGRCSAGYRVFHGCFRVRIFV